MLSIRSDKPLHPLTIEAIQEVKQCAQTLKVEVLLVGATARVILIEHIFGLNPGRATRDVDFAFAVENWDQFNQIKQYLISTGKFRQVPYAAHKLLLRSNVLGREFPVDLIPFGDIEDPDNMIAWPPDMTTVMNLAGYRDALKSALTVEITAEVNINVVSLAGLAVLKIFAWSDRGNATNNKDAIDLLTLLRIYHEIDNSDRIYHDADGYTALESFDYDPERTGAWLLGKDAATILNESTRQNMSSLLNSKKENLIMQMAQSLAGRDNAITFTTSLLEAFISGMRTH